jgi:lauroyl/myristoyl acyltransferase
LVNQAHDERIARQQRYPRAKGDDYYSKNDPRFGRQGYFVDMYGHPTMTRPHVHVVADESQGKFIITATLADGSHPTEQVFLPITASGTEVNRAVDRMRDVIYRAVTGR